MNKYIRFSGTMGCLQMRFPDRRYFFGDKRWIVVLDHRTRIDDLLSTGKTALVLATLYTPYERKEAGFSTQIL